MVSGIAREISSLPLFDPAAGEAPPAEAIELYVETPVSLGVYYSAAQEALEYGGSPAQAQRETGLSPRDGARPGPCQEIDSVR